MISVLTIVKGRANALHNLLKGLETNSILPDQLVVVFMNEPIRELPTFPFPIRCYNIIESAHLPLAAARNLAAEKADGDFLIFLDVDCIPSETLIADYQAHQDSNALLSGEVRYLRSGATAQDDFLSAMEVFSDPDPIRSDMDVIPYSLFWSLNFACQKTIYQKIGGFDEGYKGYGAEDTDFSFSAEKMQVPLQHVSAKAYHQYHESFSPPLNHLKDIIGNANRFYQKWKKWPMEGWLKAFKNMNLIDWDERKITFKRKPADEEILAALKK
ncbi:glycosyl transferase family 2 [Pedobacter psychrotolerans]|uniref:Glycosyl transferase family 2 n=1 Tax=Pedobacter psychrotolerans TaxID=1843235 RepID=A0A4R2H8H7_9SPHI|nr:galactosyltransferase-related protein [Pedobacter psychrotolerans]TCO22531.1 glycosyl transferase family 2 [Pedobacter psychrotolerans]GGE65262.1 glycosyl transferase family A [Pedobacter psychrotolerans]